MILIASREEKQLLERLRALGSDRQNVGALSAEVISLREQISALSIEKSTKEEQFARRERELQHLVGLEKKRQEVELVQGRKEIELTLREGNLVAERRQFEEQLKFNTQRFETMEKYLKDMLTDILGRLPNVSVMMDKHL